MRSTWRDNEHLHDDPTEAIPIVPHQAPAPGPAPWEGPSYSTAEDRVRRVRRIHRLARVVGYLAGLVQGLLFVRFLFRLIGVNSAAPAAQWVYSITQPLVFLFEDLFPTPQAGPYALEFYVLFAIAFYTLIGFGLKRLTRLWLAEGRRGTSARPRV